MTEKIKTRCPFCGVRLSVPAQKAGLTLKCPKCKTDIVVPISSVVITPENLPIVVSEHLEQVVPQSSGTHEQTSLQNAQLKSLRSIADSSFGSERTTDDKNAAWLTWRPAVSAVGTIIALWTAWVLFAPGQHQIETSTAMQLPELRTVQLTTGSTAPHYTHIRENLLIRVMNNQHADSPVKPDEFRLATVENDNSFNRVAVYENDQFAMTLLLFGSPDDLTSVTLMIPLAMFAGEVEGYPLGVGAAAFGRSLQRLGAVADPEWVEQLYDWMNGNMLEAMVHKEGVSLSHGRMLALFKTIRDGDSPAYLSMSIGVAAE
jgi:hypothetical protein